MKKHLKKFALLTMLSTIIIGCSQDDDNINEISNSSSANNENNENLDILKEEALNIAKLFQEENFTDIVALFDENLSSALDEINLQSAWHSTIASLGDYVGNTTTETSNTNIIIITEEYTEQKLIITLVFGDENKLSGINLNYAPTESDNISTDANNNNLDFATIEDVIIATEEHLPLEGLLTIPNDIEKPPVVLLIQGSGSSDKNATIFENMPFKDIAEGLAEQGIASLRYDRRFFTYPEEASSLGFDITYKEEILEDVSTAIKLLQKFQEENKLGDIYILGHSLGGMLVPAIASEHEVIQGIISIGGSPQPIYELSYAQNQESAEYILSNASSFAEEELALYKTQIEIVEKDILTLRGDFSDLSSDNILMGLPVAYQQYAKDYAGENFLSDLDIPMLIMQGEEDFQVSPTVDYVLYQEILKNHEDVTFKLYPELNHLMMTASGVRDISDYQIKGTVDDEVINDIALFINK